MRLPRVTACTVIGVLFRSSSRPPTIRTAILRRSYTARTPSIHLLLLPPTRPLATRFPQRRNFSTTWRAVLRSCTPPRALPLLARCIFKTCAHRAHRGQKLDRGTVHPYLAVPRRQGYHHHSSNLPLPVAAVSRTAQKKYLTRRDFIGQ